MKKGKRIIEPQKETPPKRKFSDIVSERQKMVKSIGTRKMAKKKAARKK